MRNDASENQDRDVRKLGELLKGHKYAMLTTIDEDGSLHSRPMGVLEVDFNGTLWFFTKEQAPKVWEIQHDAHVNVAFSDPSRSHFVSLRGMARLVRDHQKVAELFKPIHKAWFPEGLDDPELSLLEVRVTRADYWDPPSSTMVQLIGLAKAVLRGEAYKPGAGEVGQLHISH